LTSANEFAIVWPAVQRNLRLDGHLSRGEHMKNNIMGLLLMLAATLMLAFTPLQANASRCSASSTAGLWAYTYTGTLYDPVAGPLPAASVGHYQQDAAGNITGSQTRSVGGVSAVEDISGTLTVNHDCTGTANLNVYIEGVLQRSAVIALVYDSNLNHARYIFESVTLPDGTNVPVVLAVDGNRQVSRD
jgi:hypothetical protein